MWFPARRRRRWLRVKLRSGCDVALFLLESKNISSILVTDKDGRITTIFQRSDIFKLDILDIDSFERPLDSFETLVEAEEAREG